MKYKLVLMSLLGWSVVTSAAPQTINFTTGTGKVSFLAVGRPAAIKINGEGAHPSGKLKLDGAKLSGEMEFDLSTLQTGISLRDTHMKEKYLQVDKFPKAILILDPLQLPADFASGDEGHLKDWPFTGELTLKGSKQKVSGLAKVDRHKQNIELSANFSVKLSQFGIEIPRYLGITVAEDVSVTVVAASALQAL